MYFRLTDFAHLQAEEKTEIENAPAPEEFYNPGPPPPRAQKAIPEPVESVDAGDSKAREHALSSGEERLVAVGQDIDEAQGRPASLRTDRPPNCQNNYALPKPVGLAKHEFGVGKHDDNEWSPMRANWMWVAMIVLGVVAVLFLLQILLIAHVSSRVAELQRTIMFMMMRS
tara:strand:- start:2055 stop:2567 length:513 start_codon:yes stop_codon:yes gene_type:complete